MFWFLGPSVTIALSSSAVQIFSMTPDKTITQKEGEIFKKDKVDIWSVSILPTIFRC